MKSSGNLTLGSLAPTGAARHKNLGTKIVDNLSDLFGFSQLCKNCAKHYCLVNFVSDFPIRLSEFEKA